MSNLISLDSFREKQFASRLADILYFAYESENPRFIKLAIDLCSKAINASVTDTEIQEVERQLKA